MPEVLTANRTTGTDFYLAPNQITNPCYHCSNIFVSCLSICSGQALNTYEKQLPSFWAIGEMPYNVVKDTGYLDGMLVNKVSVFACV